MQGKTEVQKDQVVAEKEMVGWHHQLNGHEFVQTLEASAEQGSRALHSLGLQRV